MRASPTRSNDLPSTITPWAMISTYELSGEKKQPETQSLERSNTAIHFLILLIALIIQLFCSSPTGVPSIHTPFKLQLVMKTALKVDEPQIRIYWSVKKGPGMARTDDTEHQRPFFFNAKVCMLMFS